MKYRILEKTKKFYLTPRKLIWIILISLMLILFLRINLTENFDEQFNAFDAITFLGILGCIIVGLAFSLFRLNKFRYLEGKFNGELEFKTDEITINKLKIPLIEVNHIKLDAKDYKGDWGLSSFEGNFGDSYQSNGTDNNLEIEMNSGKKISVKFEQSYKYQILNEKKTLQHYCDLGKLNYASLKDLLEFKYPFS